MQDSINTLKGIVFDLDDTLYPQVSYKRSGFKVVAAWIALKWSIDQSAVLSEFEDILTQYGPVYPYMFNRLLERLGIHRRFVSDMVRLFIGHDPQIQCYDGVHSMLARLRKKYRLGILTDGRYTVQEKKINVLSLNKGVDEILYSDTMRLEKPAIALFQWFERAFALNGEQLMYVGDNPNKDFLGANQRRWSTIRVMTGEVNNFILQDVFQAKCSIPSIIYIERFLQNEYERIAES